METHRLLRQSQLEREGMAPDEAARASRLRFGQAAIARDDVGEIWTGALDGWRQDFRHAAKSLLARRGFAITAVLTLALCIGANLVVFTIVNALWLRPRAIPAPERVVMGFVTSDPAGKLESGSFGPRTIDWGNSRAEFEVVAGQVLTSDQNADNLPHILVPGVSGEVETIAASWQYFRVMGLRIVGRDFTESDDAIGAPPVAIISHRLWERAFRRSQDVIGAEIDSSPIRLRIVGVAPASFHGARLGEQADLWIPQHLVPLVARAGMGQPEPNILLLGRLRPGVTPADGERALAERRSTSTSDYKLIPVTDLYGTPTTSSILVGSQPVVYVAAAMAAVVLLAGCATLMALVLVHYERRRQELAIRLALGSSRRRLVRALTFELAGLAACGTAVAVGLSWGALRALPSLSLPGGLDLARIDLRVDPTVVVIGVLAAGVTLAVAAAMPLRRATRPALAGELVAVSSRSTASSHRLRGAILSAHVAATIVVLTAAGIFVQTVVHGFSDGPGFDVERVAFAEVKIRRSSATALLTEAQRAEQRAQRAARMADVLVAIQAHAGVQSVAIGGAPLGVSQARDAEYPHMLVLNGETRLVPATFLEADAGYLDALGLTLLAGRNLAEADVRYDYSIADDHPVVVTRTFGQLLWPGTSPVGQRFAIRDAKYTLVVVGVTSDLALGSQRLGSRRGVFIATNPLKAARAQTVEFVVRTVGDPTLAIEPIRAAIAAEFPNAPTVNVRTARDVISEDLGRERLGAWFFSGFGLVALALGVGGVFGLVAYLAESRRRELGVRLALGAQPGQIARLLIGAGLRPVAIGTASGLIAAAVLVQVVDAVVLGARHLDASAFLAAASLMLGGTTVAGFAAAWRARAIGPSEALRAE